MACYGLDPVSLTETCIPSGLPGDAGYLPDAEACRAAMAAEGLEATCFEPETGCGTSGQLFDRFCQGLLANDPADAFMARQGIPCCENSCASRVGFFRDCVTGQFSKPATACWLLPRMCHRILDDTRFGEWQSPFNPEWKVDERDHEQVRGGTRVRNRITGHCGGSDMQPICDERVITRNDLGECLAGFRVPEGACVEGPRLDRPINCGDVCAAGSCCETNVWKETSIRPPTGGPPREQPRCFISTDVTSCTDINEIDPRCHPNGPHGDRDGEDTGWEWGGDWCEGDFPENGDYYAVYFCRHSPCFNYVIHRASRLAAGGQGTGCTFGDPLYGAGIVKICEATYSDLECGRRDDCEDVPEGEPSLACCICGECRDVRGFDECFDRGGWVVGETCASSGFRCRSTDVAPPCAEVSGTFGWREHLQGLDEMGSLPRREGVMQPVTWGPAALSDPPGSLGYTEQPCRHWYGTLKPSTERPHAWGGYFCNDFDKFRQSNDMGQEAPFVERSDFPGGLTGSRVSRWALQIGFRPACVL